MLRGADVNEIQELKRQGLSISQIAAHTGFNRRTVRKYLTQPGIPRYKPPRAAPEPAGSRFRPSSSSGCRRGSGTPGCCCASCANRATPAATPRSKTTCSRGGRPRGSVAVRRFETPPGQQAQVDWGELGTLVRGRRPEADALRLCLHPGPQPGDVRRRRHRPDAPTLPAPARGGVRRAGRGAREILYDHMKTVVAGHGRPRRGRSGIPSSWRLPRYWGFTPGSAGRIGRRPKGKWRAGSATCARASSAGARRTIWPDLRAQLRPGRRGGQPAGAWHHPPGGAASVGGGAAAPAAARRIGAPFPLPGGRAAAGRAAMPMLPIRPTATRCPGRWPARRSRSGKWRGRWRSGGRTSAGHPSALRRPLPGAHGGRPPSRHARGPAASGERTGSRSRAGAPAVEVRSLAVYEAVAAGRSGMSPAAGAVAHGAREPGAGRDGRPPGERPGERPPRRSPATPTFCRELLEAELEARGLRALQTRMRVANLPANKTLAQFDFAFQP